METALLFCLVIKLIHVHIDNISNIECSIEKAKTIRGTHHCRQRAMRAHELVSVSSDCRFCFRTLF